MRDCSFFAHIGQRGIGAVSGQCAMAIKKQRGAPSRYYVPTVCSLHLDDYFITCHTFHLSYADSGFPSEAGERVWDLIPDSIRRCNLPHRSYLFSHLSPRCYYA